MSSYLPLLLCLSVLFCGLENSFAQKPDSKVDTLSSAWIKGQDEIEDQYQKGQLKSAKSLVFYNIGRAEKAYSKESTEYRLSIFYLARLYEAEGNFKSAEETYKKTAELYRKNGENHSFEYAILVREMGKLYQDNRRYQMADSLLSEATGLVEVTKGKKHEEYALCLVYKANYFTEIGEYENAVKSFDELSHKHLHKLDPFNYMSLLIDMGYAYELAGRYEDALGAYLRCENYETANTKDLSKKLDAKGVLAVARNGLGRVYEKLGDYKKAKEAFFAASSYYKSSVDKSSLEYDNYRVLLEDFAAFYETIGDYKSSENVYEKLISESKTPSDLAFVKNNLGILYESMGNYPQAEIYYLEAKNIYEGTQQLQLDQHAYANNLTNLAGLYELIGRYKLSEKLYLQAKRLDEITIGKEHPDYAATLNNIAKLYVSLQEYNKAEEHYLLAKEVIRNSMGNHHPNYVRTLSNQALLYQLMERYEESETIYKEVLALQRKMLTNKHPDYANTLNRVAGLYKLMGNTKSSEKLYEQAMKLRLELLGEEHPDYANTLNEYAQLHHYLKNRDKALELFKKSNSIIIAQIQKIYPILSESERLRFYGKQEPRLEAFYSFASDYLAELPELATELQNINLLVKGLALETTIGTKNMALHSSNDTLISMFNEWCVLRDKISQAYSKSLAEQGALSLSLDSLVEAANELEVSLSKSSEYFRNKRTQNNSPIDFHAICKKLRPEEAVIDFMSFHYHNGKNYTNERRYYAFVTHKDSEAPQPIRLMDEEQLEQILNRSMTPHSSNYATSERLSYLLYRRIWQPIEPFLGNTSTIHICPSGLLHKVSFSALMPDSSFLLEKYDLAYYGNLRDFIHLKNDSFGLDSSNRAVLVGDPAFSTAIALLRGNDKEKKEAIPDKLDLPINLIKPETVALQIGHFGRLEGTGNEVLQIQQLLDSIHCQTQLFIDKTAVEECIKSLNSSEKPDILHIATHGYFFPNIQKEDSSALQQINLHEQLRYAANPLWRSGLVLAGANFIWKGTAPPKDREDGVLMSYEVANMNLFGVGLVVLSACDTGRGDLHNSEGVLGLQRAFKAAGVHRLILSLWRVPDAETSELMTNFYRFLAKGMSTRQAFRSAQILMRKKYAPFYWAGFVLIE